MAVLRRCPACGLESDEIRCPRCNTLKLLGCSGACTTCKSECDVPPSARRAARDNEPPRGADDAGK